IYVSITFSLATRCFLLNEIYYEITVSLTFNADIDTLVPVVTVELGQSVTLTCDFAMKYQSNTWLYWYKQSAGDILTLIAMLQKSISPNYGPEISASKFIVTSNEHSSNLTIFRTVHEDEGMYHCAQMDRVKSIWSGTYISVKGESWITSVVQQTTVSGPTEPTGSETLQCSVLSDSDITTCSGEPSVFWFRSRSEKSFPDMIYTDGKKSNNCDKISDSQKRCFYNFSKNIRSSDAGTYYCAVATCGQIIFGNGNSLETKGSKKAIIVIFFLSAALAISLIGIAVLLCSIKRNKCGHCQ
uniref:Ig-like domain-containing protein n=1 Tax=Poecilia formosa TaxID=48698 RepID=A0A096MFU1_POEFO